MNTEHLSHRLVVYLALLLPVVTAMAVAVLSPSLVSAQEPECQFLVYRPKPIEFAGPAGGSDFRLYQPTQNQANIALSNIYGTGNCGWSLSPSQDWISLSRSSGTLSAEEDTVVTVSINGRAAHLPRGRHEAEIAVSAPAAEFKTRSGRLVRRYKNSIPVILYALQPCDLTITGGNYRGRAEEGSVPQLPSVARLTNAGDAPCHWEAHSDVPWLTINPASGTIDGNGVGGFQVKANSGVAQLPPDDYAATITVTWSETGPEVLGIEATLEIDAPPCELHFAEGQRFEAQGKAGSRDFTAPQTKFLLENRGGTPCYSWEAHYSAGWLSIDSDTTIYPGNATEVVVEVNQQAAAEEPPGTYSSAITFGAGNKYASSGLEASLEVEPLPCHLEIEVENDELYFRIEPEGLLESEKEQSITLRNDWTNKECAWEVESRHDWLTTDPPEETLPGGETKKVIVKILRTDAVGGFCCNCGYHDVSSAATSDQFRNGVSAPAASAGRLPFNPLCLRK